MSQYTDRFHLHMSVSRAVFIWTWCPPSGGHSDVVSAFRRTSQVRLQPDATYDTEVETALRLGGDGMEISERTVGNVVVVDVSGKITLGDGGDTILKDKLRSLVQQGRRKLLLNLADVSYIDSAGLGAVVQSYTTVTNQGGSLKLVNVTKRIQDLLAITKLLTVFDAFDNEAEAVTSFSGTPV